MREEENMDMDRKNKEKDDRRTERATETDKAAVRARSIKRKGRSKP